MIFLDWHGGVAGWGVSRLWVGQGREGGAGPGAMNRAAVVPVYEQTSRLHSTPQEGERGTCRPEHLCVDMHVCTCVYMHGCMHMRLHLRASVLF